MRAAPDSMAAVEDLSEVVGGGDGLEVVRVHWRLRFLMNGLDMRSPERFDDI